MTKSSNHTSSEKAPALGSWLPKRNRIGKFFSKDLFVVCVVLVFTGLTVASVEYLPVEMNWLKILLTSFINIILGWAIGHWWTESIRDKRYREEANRIDNRIEDEMQRVAENWQQTIHALRSLVPEPQPEFLEATHYLLGNQQNFVENSIHRWALEIDRLGFDSQDFLAEKRQRFRQIKCAISEILRTLPRESKGHLYKLFNELDPSVFFLPEDSGGEHEPDG